MPVETAQHVEGNEGIFDVSDMEAPESREPVHSTVAGLISDGGELCDDDCIECD